MVCRAGAESLESLAQVPLRLLRDIYKAGVSGAHTDEPLRRGCAGRGVGWRGGGVAPSLRGGGGRFGVWHGQGHGSRHGRGRRRGQHGRGEERVVHLSLTAPIGIKEPHLSSLLTTVRADKLDKLLEGLLGVVPDGGVGEVGAGLLDDRRRGEMET